MLTFFGPKTRFCDQVSRRSFLKVGALAAGGLTLADLLRADAQAGGTGRRKSIINIYLPGGPSHMDTFDLKPQAPPEFRGSFTPIATNVPGMEICEHLPKLARNGDKFAIIRSVTGVRDEHSPRQSDTGWSESSLRDMGGRPGIGSVLSRTSGASTGDALTSVSLGGHTTPGYLGPIYKDYLVDGGAGRENLRLHAAMGGERLTQRKELLAGLDRLRRDTDRSGMMDALDSFAARAVNIITSGKLADALDTSKEPEQVLKRYGVKDNREFYNGNRNFLLARRLIEAGSRVVSLTWGGWDTHGQNFEFLGRQLPALDVGLTALLEELHERGLLADTIVMMSGEFGRTPRVNQTAGRDHWAPASFFFVAGGGLRTGQVVGATNRLGERPQDRPVDLQQIFATVYRQLGVNIDTTFIDPNGRPQYLLDIREPITELI